MAPGRARLVTELKIPGLPAPVSHYSDATILGAQIFVSGLLALDSDGKVIGDGNAGRQADHIFSKLEKILRELGSDLGDVAKLTLYLINLADRAAVNEARKRAFGAYRPASTLVQVAALIGHGTLVEIEAVAGVRSANRRSGP